MVTMFTDTNEMQAQYGTLSTTKKAKIYILKKL